MQQLASTAPVSSVHISLFRQCIFRSRRVPVEVLVTVGPDGTAVLPYDYSLEPGINDGDRVDEETTEPATPVPVRGHYVAADHPELLQMLTL